MPPTIRIDEEVYEALKQQAEPFVDTPNTVLRRLLQLEGAVHAEKPNERHRPRRARSSELLSRFEYDRPILEVLARRGGSAHLEDVLDEVGEILTDRLTERDREPLSTGMIRWRNRAMWRRHRLVKQGLLRRDSPRGIWELSEEGRTAVSEAHQSLSED